MAVSDLNIEIGKRIRAEREKKGWSREAFAERLNMSSSFVYDLEHGKSGPSNETLIVLSDVLDVTTDTLLFGPGHKEDYTNITRHLKDLSPDQLDQIEKIVCAVVNAIK